MSVGLRIRILACGPSAAQKTFSYLVNSLGLTAIKALPPPRPTFQALLSSQHWHSGTIQVGHNEIEIVESSRINTARSFAKKPDMLRLLGVDLIHPPTTTTNTKTEEGENVPLSPSDLLRLCLGNSARIAPQLNTTFHNNSFFPVPVNTAAHTYTAAHIEDTATHTDNPLRIKEVVLGCEDPSLWALPIDQCPFLHSATPGAWQVAATATDKNEQQQEQPVVRILPSTMSSLIFYVNSFDAIVQEKALEGGYAKIGYRGLQVGQLMLKLPVPGLDVRLCEQQEVQPHFNEGSEELFKDVIKGFGDVKHDESEHCGTVVRKELIGIALKDKL